MNQSTRSSKNLFRGRSISSLPSRQISVMNIINERQSSILKEKTKLQEEKSTMMIKDNEISRLRKNLQTAVSTALFEKLQNSKNRDEINESNHLKKYLEGKIKQFQKDLKTEKEKTAASIMKNEELSSSVDILTQKCQQLEAQLRQKSTIIEKSKGLSQIIERLTLNIKDIEPLKQRIITLEGEIRQEKLLRKNSQLQVKAHQKQVQALQLVIAQTKPREQELRQRIAYFERVNLDLSRKMDDYNRRQNDYIKQITTLKLNLAKTTSQRHYFKTVYEQTTQKLQDKIIQYDKLVEQHNEKILTIQDLQQCLDIQRKMSFDLRQQIEGKNVYYKKQGEQNVILREKNQLLQAQQFELRKVIESHLRIADEVNLTIVQRTEEIKKLKQVIENTKAQLHNTELKFDEFDKLVEQGSEKGINQIRDNFYSLLRANNQLTGLVKQQRIAFDEKVITFGEERDNILRNIEVRKALPPTDETQYLSIFQQKTEAMLLLEKSNDQLLKIKKQLQGKIEQLYGEIEKQKKQMNLLKLKTADLFRAKKQLEDARKSIQRYQEMIEEDKQVIDDIKSQVNVLRERNNELNQKNFVVELQRRNLDIQIKEMNEVMKELNVQTLMGHKQINEKNSHLMMDTLQKLDSAVKSLAFFFHCAFCGELPATPITLALCGHNYCTKCKEAYAQSCYQCDTGQPIQKVFQNKFLKDAGGKYRFLTMVLAQLKANFNKRQ